MILHAPQVDGKDGIQILLQKIERRGIGVLFDGSAATLGSSFVGHYPWFATFNSLQARVYVCALVEGARPA